MHKLVGGTPSQFRTRKAHYLARSVGRPKRRYVGVTLLRRLHAHPPPQRKKLALAVRTVRMSGYMHMMSLLRHLPLGAKAPSGGIIFFG